jgi:pimeloyl-ACP methyl ester carboxylesterase
MPERELTVVARNNESFARFCWDPCLHNPKLMRRLHRVRVPTLFVGASTTASLPRLRQGVQPDDSAGQVRYRKQAGHYPHLEQPSEFLTLVQAFCV